MSFFVEKKQESNYSRQSLQCFHWAFGRHDEGWNASADRRRYCSQYCKSDEVVSCLHWQQRKRDIGQEKEETQRCSFFSIGKIRFKCVPLGQVGWACAVCLGLGAWAGSSVAGQTPSTNPMGES